MGDNVQVFPYLTLEIEQRAREGNQARSPAKQITCRFADSPFRMLPLLLAPHTSREFERPREPDVHLKKMESEEDPPASVACRRRVPEANWQDRLTPWTIGIITVLVTFGNQLFVPPLNRLIELGMCRDYYRVHDPSVIMPGGNVKESLCKNNAIQTNVAELLGTLTTLSDICGAFRLARRF